MEEIIKKRIEELLTERDGFILKVEKQMFAYDVAIGELQHILEISKSTEQKNIPEN